MKKIFSMLAAIFLYTIYVTLLPISHIHAASEFTTTFNSVYLVEVGGETSVTHTITLKNNLSHIYATDYTLATSGDHLSHIVASDEGGPLTVKTNEQNGTTTIHITIDRPAIGLDKVKTLTLSYHTTDVVEVIGDTTTISIPRLSRANEADSYTRTVKVAGLAGKAAHIYPQPDSENKEDGMTSYTFVGHGSDSLTLLFGDSVTYKLNLSYTLKNKELSAADTELALPPDTDYQHVILQSITPPPMSIRVDQDGNWLARYSLKSQEKTQVSALLYVTVYPQPTQFDPSGHTAAKSTRSKYWDTTASLVTDLAGKLKTPENIYTYLTTNFTYNYAGVTGGHRLGAVAALSSPTLVLCTEFTDTFVSLARAAGIPAREINGYGFTTNTTLRPQSTTTDVLHAWPEYYDASRNLWIEVDPTWGNTTGGVDYFNKLDFSHITFVRHGLEDAYPLPAGAYKETAEQKTIDVTVASEAPVGNASSEVRGNQIVNTGNVAIVNTTVGYLPPYGSFTLQSPHAPSLYDKIKALCANLLSKFWRLRPASM